LPDERPFKIDIKYLDDRTARIHYSVDQDIRIPQDAFDRASFLVLEHLEHKQGDVLVFLPGIRDIYALKKKIQGLKNNIQEDRFVIIHSQYAEGLNKRLFNKKVKNKIILSSSMGESSITLPNCVTIIDFCLSKSHASDKKTGQSTFQTHLSSKATL
jgi:HrpA-like RNA helicase